MTEGVSPYIAILVPAGAMILLAVGYLARRFLDGVSNGVHDVPFRGAALISSESAREITTVLQDMVKAHERQAAATEAILESQIEQTRAAAAERHAAELDDLRRQVERLTRERDSERPAPAKRP